MIVFLSLIGIEIVGVLVTLFLNKFSVYGNGKWF